MSFVAKLARIINNKESNSIILSGNVHDLFPNQNNEYDLSLVDYLSSKWDVKDRIHVIYEVNKPLYFSNIAEIKKAWISWRDSLGVERKSNIGPLDEFNKIVLNSSQETVGCLEFLRQLTICSRQTNLNLLIFIEGADLLFPSGNNNFSSLSAVDRASIRVAHSWFSDALFQNSNDVVILISESFHSIHEKISRLPQILNVEVPLPDLESRGIILGKAVGDTVAFSSECLELAKLSAGLTIQSLKQLVAQKEITRETITNKIEEYISSQLGEDVVEFKNPTHSFNDVIGNTKLKKFLKDEVINRFKSSDETSLTGIIVSGPIGGGKTFIFEALAGELGIPVLVLKNIRSQWFGQTDVIFERLKRLLLSLSKVCVFVDEADTQFGGTSNETHDTEKRLTGKIQSMMSDTKLRGKVHWLLMTARINQLSPDIRRPGRGGDLIIPVFDPDKEDRKEFLKWTLNGILSSKKWNIDEIVADKDSELAKSVKSYSAAAFSSLRSQLKYKFPNGEATLAEVKEVVNDIIPADISEMRRYQTLQALLNCTRFSLLPQDEIMGDINESRKKWRRELHDLEIMFSS